MLAGCGTPGDTASGSPSSSAPADARELVRPGDAYADASRFGSLVFTAGHLPSDSSAPIEEQVESSLDNLEITLESAGAGLDTLLKVNIYLTDWDNWEAFNTIYVDRIGEHGLPPRATVQIAGLGFDSLIEIEATAYVRGTAP
jgi:2-iminobutanoate/2-iminopropanoate deaminase